MALILSLASDVCASWFSSEPEEEEEKPQYIERKSAIVAPAQVSEFERVVSIRDERLENRRTFDRLSNEKKAELDAAEKLFRSEYGMRSDRQYNFNATNNTIYLISTDPKVGGGSTNSPVFLPHRVFATMEERNAFLAALQAKGLLAQQISVIASLSAENDAEMAKIDEYMLKVGGVAKGNNFRYDRRSHSVYEFVLVQPKKPKMSKDEQAYAESVKVEAEKKKILEERAAAEAAEAKAREDAKIREEAERQLKAEAKAREEADHAKRLEAKRQAEKAEAEARAAAKKKAAEQKAAERAREEAAEKAEAEARAAAKKKAAEQRAAEKAREEAAEKAEAEARAAAKKKAEQEKAKAVEEAKKLCEKFANKDYYDKAVQDAKNKLESERQPELDNAKRQVAAATVALKSAESKVAIAEVNLKQAKAQKSENTADFKKLYHDAEDALDEAEDALDEAKKKLKSAEKLVAAIPDDAESAVKAARRAAEKKARK